MKNRLVRARKVVSSAIYNFFLRLGIEIRKVTPVNIAPAPSGNITFAIGSQTLLAPANHALPSLLKDYPNYGWVLGRLVKLIHTKYPNLLVIDVGANIGDSAAIIQNAIKSKIVCIEGSEKFYPYLLHNIRQYQDVVAFKKYLGETEKVISTSVEENQGTIRLLPEKGPTTVTLSTLDKFLLGHPQYLSAQFLKVDADGYDLQILRGGIRYIKKTKPALYIEYAKFYFEQFKDDGPKTLLMLEKIGYIWATVYDNYGRLFFSTPLDNHLLLQQIDTYLTKGKGAFPYVDIVLFHKKDRLLAEKFIQQENNYLQYTNAKA